MKDYSAILSHFKIDLLNEMQKKSVESILKPSDVILISPTGSGKTLAFLLSAMQLVNRNIHGVQILILVPTRELAQQIEQVFKQMKTDIRISCCYGGHPIQIEKNNLLQPPAILAGTPGRIAHHLDKGHVSADKITVLILDEFDKSLDAGFEGEMSFIISRLTGLRKRVLTSATTLNEIPEFVGLQNAITLDFTNTPEQSNSSLTIKTVKARGIDKMEALTLLIGKLSGSKIIFCNHRDAVERISEHLNKLKITHGTYHGGLDQIDREKVLIKLKNGSISLLISTDLASRGLDIPEIECIIHYQLPATEDIMTHRNGRTARMHASGNAYLLLKETDHLPSFLKNTPDEEALPDKFVFPKASDWETLYISAGKKDKIHKTDIAGMLLQKGALKKEDLGKIDVLDHSAYVAIRKEKIRRTIQLIQNEKIKNKKVKFKIST